ncbi:MAG: prepilin peptidase [Bdellovibrionaceae bacterium]|nr:prepilin peptidase [Pseudobdellovibrionaceae bacterium]
MLEYLSYLLPGIILSIACIDDLRSKKIHNKLIIFMLVLTLPAVFLLNGWEGLMAGFISALLALFFAVPLTLARVIGGGDLKLFVLIAFTLNFRDLFWISIYSLFWALILGLIKITLDKKLKDFLWNILFLFKHRSAKGLNFHSIPYSVALFMAWLSFLTLRGLS